MLNEPWPTLIRAMWPRLAALPTVLHPAFVVLVELPGRTYFWASHASITTITMGKSALLKKRFNDYLSRRRAAPLAAGVPQPPPCSGGWMRRARNADFQYRLTGPD